MTDVQHDWGNLWPTTLEPTVRRMFDELDIQKQVTASAPPPRHPLPTRKAPDMPLPLLLDDALSTSGDRFALRVSLPWIRSLPVASLTAIALTVDGMDVMGLRVRLGGRTVAVEHLAAETGWWFVQDRVVVIGDRALTPDPHAIALSFRLMIPYLSNRPDAPLMLPFHTRRVLPPDAASAPPAARDVA